MKFRIFHTLLCCAEDSHPRLIILLLLEKTFEILPRLAFFWYGVVAVCAPRVAAHYAEKGEPGTNEYAVHHHRLYAILRTGGRVSAGVG